MDDELANARAAYDLALIEQQKAINEAIAAAEASVRAVCDETQAVVDQAMQRLLTLKRISDIRVN